MNLTVDIRRKLPGFTLNVRFNGSDHAMGLLGASGSGKSMTLRCIAGLEKPDAGRITLNGRVLFDSEARVNVPVRERRIGFLFQNYALFPNMTVADNIGFALDHLNPAARKTAVEAHLAAVHLEGLGSRYPHQLSGGQQQRAALARALAVKPEALLLDEPFSALDDFLRSRMIHQLRDLLSDYRGALLMVSHNMDEAFQLCDRLVVLSGGRVEAAGDKRDIFHRPPSCETARLTGCKNLAPAEAAVAVKSSEAETGSDLSARIVRVRVPAWGMFLDGRQIPKAEQGTVSKRDAAPSAHPVTEAVEGPPRFAGIRAHDIRLAAPGETANTTMATPSAVSETPFRAYLHLSLEGGAPSAEDGHLMWDISREEWASLAKNPPPWRICLPVESVMIMGE